MSTIEAPRLRLRGAVVRDGDPGWDLARQAFNLTVDQRPVAVAFPADVADVQAVVRYAADAGLRVAPQRTGHNAAPLGSVEDAIVVRTDNLQGVRLDAARRHARVGAGHKWQDVVPAASELGLAALHGSTGDVSVVGYSLGGGLGWYGRKHGLASNKVTAVELVTADGELVRADRDTEPELFWALRGGGGGNFGVVTAIEFDLVEQPLDYAGVLFFPWERTDEVLHAWHEWLPTTPDELTSVGRVLQFPPFPEVPEPLRGKAFALVEAVYLGSEADGRELLEPLRELGPAIDTFALVPPAEIAELHMDPPHPVAGVTAHTLLGELGAAGIDALVAAAGPESGSRLLSVELRQLGGALARTSPEHGALDMLRADYAMFGVGIAPEPALAAASEAQLDAVLEALAPWQAGLYSNFTEHRTGASSFFVPETQARLRAVKERLDPDDLFRANYVVD
ncbi:MAG TPA: FAD-binding oxidoreductase [Gaiellaceae bacterium]|nr:FAD-binding oxidoreductase [Gaiellaceae bacterium]